MNPTDVSRIAKSGHWNMSPLMPVGTPASGLIVSWARHLDDVRAAQRLRHQVFLGDTGARLPTPVEGHDIDLFDDFCEHLLVRRVPGGDVVGTCRVLTPAQARRVGSTCTDTAFDLTRLRGVRERLVEVGRACVHPDHRQGSVVLALWGALGHFMLRNKLDTLIGCAGVPLHQDGRVAASIWRQVKQRHLAPVDWHVRPRLPLPVDRLDDSLEVRPTALIKGCLRLGARVMGPPAWNPDFNTADLPLLLRLADMPVPYRRHLLGA